MKPRRTLAELPNRTLRELSEEIDESVYEVLGTKKGHRRVLQRRLDAQLAFREQIRRMGTNGCLRWPKWRMRTPSNEPF